MKACMWKDFRYFTTPTNLLLFFLLSCIMPLGVVAVYQNNILSLGTYTLSFFFFYAPALACTLSVEQDKRENIIEQFHQAERSVVQYALAKNALPLAAASLACILNAVFLVYRGLLPLSTKFLSYCAMQILWMAPFIFFSTEISILYISTKKKIQHTDELIMFIPALVMAIPAALKPLISIEIFAFIMAMIALVIGAVACAILAYRYPANLQ
ncbi:hypothetical protein EP30_01670 [Bifidobacterium sp. UTCIF-39]|uniref:hypothetical protein n=1 Tax=Bifidobacterium sp. UTCIF-39 TaxID=1465359 RepID=UPI00112D3FD1|nr:hypothetical protein [Bifidobacterium sp. UTCIF-39]TPF97675.1 hypothetical protein EP30_01670 [Bifidobacterium sp. UTCIF-39]